MTLRDRFEQLNRLPHKQLTIILILVDFYPQSDMVALLDELIADLGDGTPQ